MEAQQAHPPALVASQLRAAGLIVEAAERAAVQACPTSLQSLFIHLVLQGAIDDEVLAEFVARDLELDRLVDAEPNPEPEVFALVPVELIHDLGVLPMRRLDAETLLVGVVDPYTEARLEEVAFFAGLALEPRVLSLRAMARRFHAVVGRPWKVSEKLLGDARREGNEGLVGGSSLAKLLRRVHHSAAPRASTPSEAVETVAPTVEPAPSGGPAPVSMEGEASAPAQAAYRAPFVSLTQASETGRNEEDPARVVEGRFSTRTPSAPVRMPILPTLGVAEQRHHEGSFASPSEIFRRSAAASVATRAAFRQAIRGLEIAMSRDDVGLELTNSLLLAVPNVSLYSLRVPRAVIWQVASRRGPATLPGLAFPMEEGSVWHQCAQHGTAYRGRIPPTDPGFRLLGREMGEDSIVVPLMMKARTVALLLLDSGYEPGLPGMKGQWEPLHRAISEAFRRAILQRKRTETS
jgi:hypothetical protein